MIAFDADVLIYASDPDNPLGQAVRELFQRSDQGNVGLGSALLLPEVLTKPVRSGTSAETAELTRLLRRLELVEATEAICLRAVALGAKYGLTAMDAIHLATAVTSGAEAFLTNNTKDFKKHLVNEVPILNPGDLLPAA